MALANALSGNHRLPSAVVEVGALWAWSPLDATTGVVALGLEIFGRRLLSLNLLGLLLLLAFLGALRLLAIPRLRPLRALFPRLGAGIPLVAEEGFWTPFGGDGYLPLVGLLVVLGLGALAQRRYAFLHSFLLLEGLGLAVNLLYVVAGATTGTLDGETLVLFTVAVAAAETAVGLALFLALSLGEQGDGGSGHHSSHTPRVPVGLRSVVEVPDLPTFTPSPPSKVKQKDTYLKVQTNQLEGREPEQESEWEARLNAQAKAKASLVKLLVKCMENSLAKTRVKTKVDAPVKAQVESPSKARLDAKLALVKFMVELMDSLAKAKAKAQVVDAPVKTRVKTEVGAQVDAEVKAQLDAKAALTGFMVELMDDYLAKARAKTQVVDAPVKTEADAEVDAEVKAAVDAQVKTEADAQIDALMKTGRKIQ